MHRFLFTVMVLGAPIGLTGCPDQSCDYDGKVYSVEESFPSADGCNSCFCDKTGDVVCTEKACVRGCTVGDMHLEVGQSVPANDGCNTCTCSEDLNMVCSETPCPPKECDEGQSFFEAGCGLEDGMPEIEAGCYASCLGVPCETGVCQLTDINPCVCNDGQECCEACGAHEWLCLDAPKTCGPVSPSGPVIVSAENSFGECGEGCLRTLSLISNESARCGEATLRICDNLFDSASCEQSNMGVLTPLGNAKAAGLAAELSGVSLDAVYGCPDCADGGASKLTLRYDAADTSVRYEFHRPPEVLAAADAFVQGLIEALDSCVATVDIFFEPDGCTPLK